MVSHNGCARRVTIGLPVCNGQRHVGEAIESILAQTFGDFELIISDNASTDMTEEICRKYAAYDDRISYHRNDKNLGAAYNFNHLCEIARGSYFKWAAHDDLLVPEFLERCVEALDTNPEAVLCYTGVHGIDAEGRLLGIEKSGSPSLDDARPSHRLRAALFGGARMTMIFGLIRREALEGTELHRSYSGSDRTLLAELALRGRFVSVPEPLFMHRDHPERFSSAIYPYSLRVRAWYDPSATGRVSRPKCTRLVAHVRMVGRWVEEPRERLRCYAWILRWLSLNSNPIIFELLGSLDPRLAERARALKRRLVGWKGDRHPHGLSRQP